MERFKLIPSIYLILEREGQILLSRRCNTGFEDGNYGLVAGHAEEHEAMSAAMAREAKEEAGITIHPEDLQEVVTMHRNCGNHERVDFFFTTSIWEGEIQNREPDKCDDLSWFPIGDMPHNVIPYIKEAIGCFETGKTYVEWGFEKK
jgi:8-oxo-dGTP diphosphatase